MLTTSNMVHTARLDLSLGQCLMAALLVGTGTTFHLLHAYALTNPGGAHAYTSFASHVTMGPAHAHIQHTNGYDEGDVLERSA